MMGIILGILIIASVGVGIYSFMSIRKESKKANSGRSTSRQSTRRSR